MCKANVKLQIITTNNISDYVNNVDESDDKYPQEKTIQKTFVAQIVDPTFPVKLSAMTIALTEATVSINNCIFFY